MNVGIERLTPVCPASRDKFTSYASKDRPDGNGRVPCPVCRKLVKLGAANGVIGTRIVIPHHHMGQPAGAAYVDALAAKQAPAATEAPSEPTTQQILSLERRSNMSDDEAIRFARAVLSLAARTRAPAVGASPIDVRDAARYRGLRDGGYIPAPVQPASMHYTSPTETDEAVDAALAAVGASVQPVLASLSDEQIDAIVASVMNGCFREYDHDDVRLIVRAALASSTPTKGGEAS